MSVERTMIDKIIEAIKDGLSESELKQIINACNTELIARKRVNFSKPKPKVFYEGKDDPNTIVTLH